MARENYLDIEIDLSRDFLFDKLGIQRLQESYMKDDETSPQHRFAFVSKTFGSNPDHVVVPALDKLNWKVNVNPPKNLI